MLVEQVYCCARQWLFCVLHFFHIVYLDSEAGKLRQILNLQRKGEDFIEFVSIKRASIKLRALLRIIEDKLNFDVYLEAEVIEAAFEGHLRRRLLARLLHGL